MPPACGISGSTPDTLLIPDLTFTLRLVRYFYTQCKEARKHFSQIFYLFFLELISPATSITSVLLRHTTIQQIAIA
jgi:hypothetical protein